MAAALALNLVPGLSASVERAAGRFEDRAAYASAVLRGRAVEPRAAPSEAPGALGPWYGLASGAGAVALASVALFRRRLAPARVRRTAAAWFGPRVRAVRSLQSGHAGDYAGWFTAGAAALGGLLALAVR